MLKLVLRVFSFSGMPVADRPLGTRVREYFVTTRTVPWTSYRKAFRVCKPRRVYFILFNFDSWAIRGILETWSCQSTKVREKKWKKKKKTNGTLSPIFCRAFIVTRLKQRKESEIDCELTKQFPNMDQCNTSQEQLFFTHQKVVHEWYFGVHERKMLRTWSHGSLAGRRIFHKCFTFMKRL